MARPGRHWTSLLAIALASIVSAQAAAQYQQPTAPSTPTDLDEQRRTAPPPPPMTSNAGTTQTTPAAPVANSAATEVLLAAACVAGRNADSLTALLATTPFSPDERERAGRLLRAAERCLRPASPLSTSALALRGAVAETLYESRFAQAPAVRSPAAGSAPYFQPSALAGTPNAAALAAHFDIAQCAVPRQPELVRALLATDPGSPTELTALSALYPTFSACVGTGAQLRVDRAGIRAILAETLYRWSVVQRDGPTSPWAASPTAAAPTG